MQSSFDEVAVSRKEYRLGPWTKTRKQLTSIPVAYSCTCIFSVLPRESNPHGVATTHLEPNNTQWDNNSYYFNLSNHTTSNTPKLLDHGKEKLYILWPTRNFPLSQWTAFSVAYCYEVFHKWAYWPQIRDQDFDSSWQHFNLVNPHLNLWCFQCVFTSLSQIHICNVNSPDILNTPALCIASKTRYSGVAQALSAPDSSSQRLSNVRAALHHIQRGMKCHTCSWPCALHPSSCFHQTLCPQAQVLLHGQREQALTFEDRAFFIYLFSRRRENRASASIDFSYVCSESVAKFWEFHIFSLPLRATPQICLSMPWGVNKRFHFWEIRKCSLGLSFCTKSYYCLPFLTT